MKLKKDEDVRLWGMTGETALERAEHNHHIEKLRSKC